ncbi:MAG TPA: LLM class F420-dependent oxidoreductase [Candidatus Dormibacteraeota bacterium]|nr:LLM class F420-dependent oxidoreductase [Candidatus Dormibacteraeota bacterium]
MKLGLMFANTGAMVSPEGAAEVARHAEQAGFESLWTVEHVVVPAGYESKYPYNRSGKMAGGDDAPIPDPLIWLAYVAAHTERLKLATGMLILPQRSPLVTAKEVATLDVLSHGRVILGVGIGWLREEFEAIGVDFETRGRRAVEGIEAMRRLWADDQPSYEGRSVRFHDARLWPKPLHRRVPIVLGGHGEVAARRAGRLADGFFPGRSRPDEVRALLQVMRRAAEDAGRDPAQVELTLGAPPDRAFVEQLVELGVDRVVLPPMGLDVDSVKAGIDQAVETLAALAAT